MSDFDRFGAMSFDCYGTLIDWETGILSTADPIRFGNSNMVSFSPLAVGRGSLLARRQYVELLKTEGVTLCFRDDAVAAIAEIASTVNQRTENIGARRLYTVMEKLLEEVSFTAPDLAGQELVIDGDYVYARLAEALEDQDLSRYIL